MVVPDIKPLALKQYDIKQSKYDVVGKLPIRSVLLGPSGGGKTVLLVNMVMDIYKNLFERVYIFSPSIDVDMTWNVVKKHLDKEMTLSNNEPKLYYSDYDAESFELIIENQKKNITHQKSDKETKKIFQILIIIDDFADDPSFSRHSKLLHSLFTRGRHSCISTIVSTQKFTALHPIIRVNACSLFVFRLRNHSDLQTFLDELGAICSDKKVLLKMYQLATEKPFSFLYCNLVAKDKNDMFFIRFNQKLLIEDN
jgi:hypothetical protein